MNNFEKTFVVQSIETPTLILDTHELFKESTKKKMLLKLYILYILPNQKNVQDEYL